MMASTQRLGSLKTGLFIFILWACLVTAQESNGNNCKDSDSQTVYSLLCKLPLNVNVTRKEFTVFFTQDDGTEVSLVDCRWPGEGFYCFKWKGVDCVQPVSDRVNIIVPGSVACKTGQFKVKIFDTSPVGKTDCHPVNQPVEQVGPVTQTTDKDLTPPITEDTNSTAMIVSVSVVAVAAMVLLVTLTVVYIKRNEVRQWLKQKTAGNDGEKNTIQQSTSLLRQTTTTTCEV